MKVNLRKGRKGIVTALVVALTVSAVQVAVYAKAPTKEKVEYKGKGRVEVDFNKDVKYRNSKVTVKDTDGNVYKATIYERDDDELKFRINNYKAGKKYNFTIKGIKQVRTKDYGTVKGSFRIPAPKKTPAPVTPVVPEENTPVTPTVPDQNTPITPDQGGNVNPDQTTPVTPDQTTPATPDQGTPANITAKEAANIALADAGLNRNQVWELDVEKEYKGGKVFYEVEFEAGQYDYEYAISLQGDILFKDAEWDD